MRLISIDGGGYSATVNLERGANCIKLRDNRHGISILREPDYSAGELDNPYLYGMPILFPVNRIFSGSFEFEGRTYRFPINEPSTGCHLHGELHCTEFELVESSASRIVCAYRAKADQYLSFPHAFEILMEYSLGDDGLTHKTKVTNLSNENMPCMLGFHTTFNAQGESKAFVDIAEEYRRNMKNYLPTGEKPEFDEVTNRLKCGEFSPFEAIISRHYRAGKTGLMSLEDNSVKIVYENDAKFAFRLIYNGQANEYICLEPQTCLANAPHAPFSREECGFDFIEPKKSKTYISKIYVEEKAK